jgi:hypothetical protein
MRSTQALLESTLFVEEQKPKLKNKKNKKNPGLKSLQGNY